MLTDADGVGTNALKIVDSAVGECEVCLASEKAPRLTVAGTSQAWASDEQVKVDLIILGNLITLHAMDPSLRYAMSAMAPSQNPLEERGAPACSRITVFGKPACVQMDSDCDRGYEVRTDLRPGRNIRLRFQGRSTHP